MEMVPLLQMPGIIGGMVTRDSGIAVARGVASLQVILLHATGPYISSFGPGWDAENLLCSFNRTCVPIFLMISGAALAARQPPDVNKAFWRAGRLLALLLIWTTFYAVWINGLSLDNLVLTIVSFTQKPVYYHLWYIYLAIAIHLLIPAFQGLFRSATMAQRLCYAAIFFMLSPYVVRLTGGPSPAVLAFSWMGTFGGWLAYLIVGGCLVEWLRDASVRRRWIVCVGGLAAYVSASAGIAVLTADWSAQAGRPIQTLYEYQAPLVVLASIGLYAAIMAGSPIFSSWKGLILAMEGLMSGVYFVHAIVLEFCFRYTLKIISGPQVAVSLVAGISCFMASIALVWLARLAKPVRFLT